MTHPMFLQDEVVTYEVLLPGIVKKLETAYGTIYVSIESGDIHFVQRWRYRFQVEEILHPAPRKADPWTDDEERDFHTTAAALIWKFWNSSPLLPRGGDPSLFQIIDLLNADRPVISARVSGTGDFAKKFASKSLPIDFDIALSVTNPHYSVTVRKMIGDRFVHSFVNYGTRSISFVKTAVEKRGAQQDGRDPAATSDFISVPHEFGHAIGYQTDEYQAYAAKHRDVKSLMNIGREIRPRHLEFIRTHLAQMFAGSRFEFA